PIQSPRTSARNLSPRNRAMNPRPLALLAGLTAFALAIGFLPGQELQPQGVEVMARGPVHEAFAEPTNTRPEPSPVIPKQPPDPVEELPPEQKPEGNNVQWISGYWAWDDATSDFL